MKNYTEQRFEEFDKAYPTHGFDNNAENEFHSQLIKRFIAETIQRAEQEMYIQGFKDGFQHSTEGFNGEYQHPDVPKNFLEEDAKEALLLRQTINR